MEHLDTQVREVYERVGLTMSLAQCLEHRLAVLLTCANDFGPDGCTAERYDKVLRDFLARPFGQMVSELCDSVKLPPELERRLRNAVTIRNRLAHRYFRESVGEFVSPDGRRVMIEELDRLSDELNELDDHVERLQIAWLRQGVITLESLVRCIETPPEEA